MATIIDGKAISQAIKDETKEAIKYLDEYIEMKGTKYTSHYMALRKWVFDAVKEKKHKNTSTSFDEALRNA